MLPEDRGTLHRHQAFGLIFSCRQPLPGWPRAPEAQPVDVALTLSSCPCGHDDVGRAERDWREVTRSEHLDAAGRPLVRVEERAGARRFLYHDGARFEVDHEGRRARLAWPAESSLDAAWLYFCGPVLTWILRLHGRVVLHAAAVSLPSPLGAPDALSSARGAILLAGPSGAGKSTTAASLALAGCPLLSDDSAALTGGGDRGTPLEVWPDSPRLRLWPSSAAAVAGVDIAALPRLCDGWEKRAFDAATFDACPRPVLAVYALQVGRAVSFTPVPPARALPLLVAHAAAAELADRAMRRREFELLADLVARVPVILVTRPDGRDLAPALLDDARRRLGLGAVETLASETVASETVPSETGAASVEKNHV